MPSRTEGQRLRRFILVAFGWAWAFDVLGLSAQGALRKVMLGLSMWGPAVGALVAEGRPWLVAVRRLYSPQGLPGRRSRAALIIAVLVPPAATLLGTVLAVVVGAARWNPGRPSVRAVAGIVGAATLISPVLNFPAALGEELGWRGFLLPRLEARLGIRRALLLTGIIWGVWHGPLVVMGFNYPEHPWLAIPLMICLTSALTLLLAALTYMGGSVTAPVLAHGSINGFAGLPTLLLVGGDSAIAPPAGALVWLPLGLAALAFLRWVRPFTSDARAPGTTPDGDGGRPSGEALP